MPHFPLHGKQVKSPVVKRIPDIEHTGKELSIDNSENEQHNGKERNANVKEFEKHIVLEERRLEWLLIHYFYIDYTT